MILKEIMLYAYCLPLTAPVRLPGTILTQREGLLVALHTDDGRTVWGEAAPLPGFSRESLEKVADGARVVAEEFRGKTPKEAHQCDEVAMRISPSLSFAFESALDALLAQESELPVHKYLHSEASEKVSLCMLLDGDDAALRAGLQKAFECGCRVLKLKVGRGTIESDIGRVTGVIEMMPPGCRLRLDANRAWHVAEAQRFCRAIPVSGIDFLEEPVKEYEELPVVQETTGVTCAVDETLQQLSRCIALKMAGGSDPEESTLRFVVEQAGALVWKPTLCLSPWSLDIDIKTPVVLSGAYESGIGTAAILARAAAFSGKVIAAGVDTYSRLAGDVLEPPLPLEFPEFSLTALEQVQDAVNLAKLKRLWHV